MTPPPKCLYDLLGIPRTASSDDIKKAYRHQALVNHPDKNPNNRDEAEENFKLIQHAYTVLSDPHERAWYDSHRQQILRGVDVSHGGDVNANGNTSADGEASAANATDIDLFAYFNPSAYSGFTGEDGFYAVFSGVFDTLAREEAQATAEANSRTNRDAASTAAAPPFGTADTDWTDVRAFYAAWESFSSRKTFTFGNKWNLAKAPARHYRRAMERENKRERTKLRKEFNGTVRELAAYVKKRDPRVAKQRKVEEMQRAESEVRQRMAWERKRQERRDARAFRDEVLEEDGEELDVILESIANDERIERRGRRGRRRGGGRGGGGGKDSDGDGGGDGGEGTAASNEEQEDGEEEDAPGGASRDLSDEEEVGEDGEVEEVVSGDSGEEEVLEELYCAACRKSFRTAAQQKDHERSKKHKGAIAKLQREVLLEEATFQAGNDGEPEVVNVEKHAGESDIIDVTSMSKKRRKKERRRAMRNTSFVDVNEVSQRMESVGLDDGGKVENEVKEVEDGTGDGGEGGDGETSGLKEEEVQERALSKKEKRRLRERQKKALADGNGQGDDDDGTRRQCNKCGVKFASRTKLMQHVRESGHALHVEKPRR